ncbi:MAG TPA: Crp/Fnr family transcriptional regulator [Puia sp.]|jgi:CRP/FNR family cyclic AMP-dependent transcriptional regulator|nr:Crp/Fnr family transcriptional regulator [Puia sp.]
MHLDSSIILRKFPLFSDLSDEEYHELNVSDNYKEAKKGEFIYFEAYQHQNIYFLKSGIIRLGYLDGLGNKVIKDILKPGDFFGQVSLEKENLGGEFAQAGKEDVSLCSFTLDSFNRLLLNKPKLAVKYSKISGFRIRRFENRLQNILQLDVKTRLKLFIEQLLTDVKDRAKWLGKEVRIPNYLTHEEIAQLIGTSRQTVTTLLNAFDDEHVFSFSRKEIRFFNKENNFGK